MSRLTVTAWRRAVFRSHAISDPVRVYLLYLAEHMRQDRKVSVPRSDVAKALGKSERIVTKRSKEAHDAGFLSTVARGQKGRTAVYQGVTPAAFSGSPTNPLNVPQYDPHTGMGSRGDRKFSGNPGVPTYNETDLFVTTHHRNVGNNEETELLPVRSELQVCDCHGFIDCANLTPLHNREESA